VQWLVEPIPSQSRDNEEAAGRAGHGRVKSKRRAEETSDL
jgi:hypothetical protein